MPSHNVAATEKDEQFLRYGAEQDLPGTHLNDVDFRPLQCVPSPIPGNHVNEVNHGHVVSIFVEQCIDTVVVVCAASGPIHHIPKVHT